MSKDFDRGRITDAIDIFNAIVSSGCEDPVKLARALDAAAAACEVLLVEYDLTKRERDIFLEAISGLSGRDVPKGQAPGAVYFMTVGNESTVKIGFSTNIESRMKSLQTGLAEKARVLASFPGSKSDESKMHERFSRYRRRGEWFVFSEEIRAFVKSISSP